MSPPRCSFCLSSLGDLVWVLQFSGMQRPHGVLGNRSFPHEWRQHRHQTRTPFFNTAPTCSTSKPHFHYKLTSQRSSSNHLAPPFAKKPHKRSELPQYNDISKSNFLKASPPHLLIVRCSSHNLHHTPEPTSCSPAAKRMRLRTAVSVLP